MTDEILKKLDECENNLLDMNFEFAGKAICDINQKLREIKNAPEYKQDIQITQRAAAIEKKIALGLDSLANPQNYQSQIVQTQSLPDFLPFSAEIPAGFAPDIKISIIIPVYNCERWIERCFNSIVNQKYKKNLLEAVFVDDCSIDNSFAVLRKIVENYESGVSADEKITFKLFKQPQNLGQGRARNKGLAKSLGDYVYFMDSDDELSENSLLSLAYLAQKYKGVDIVQGNCYVVSGGGDSDCKSAELIYATDNRIFPEYTKNALWIKQRFPFYSSVADRINWELWGKLIRKDFIVENNLYQGDFLTGQDMHFCFLSSKKIKDMAFTKAKTYVYYMEHLSVTSRKSGVSKLFSWLDLYNEMLSHIDWEVALIYINHIKSRINEFNCSQVEKRVNETSARIENGLASLKSVVL